MTVTRLNLPGRLSRAFVASRLTLPLILAMLTVGLVGLIFTPRDENPQIIVPAVEVTVPLPGAPLKRSNTFSSHHWRRHLAPLPGSNTVTARRYLVPRAS